MRRDREEEEEDEEEEEEEEDSQDQKTEMLFVAVFQRQDGASLSKLVCCQIWQL